MLNQILKQFGIGSAVFAATVMSMAVAKAAPSEKPKAAVITCSDPEFKGGKFVIRHSRGRLHIKYSTNETYKWHAAPGTPWTVSSSGVADIGNDTYSYAFKAKVRTTHVESMLQDAFYDAEWKVNGRILINLKDPAESTFRGTYSYCYKDSDSILFDSCRRKPVSDKVSRSIKCVIEAAK